jgi:hypothetical protein
MLPVFATGYRLREPTRFIACYPRIFGFLRLVQQVRTYLDRDPR